MPTYRSTTRINFPLAVRAVQEQDQEALEQLESIAKSARNYGRKLRHAVADKDAERVEEALYYLSGLGSVVNSWGEK